MAKELALPPENINMEAWAEWLEYRKAAKKAVSQFAANKQWKMLGKYSLTDQQAIIDHSISNDYQGLFELKRSFQPAGPDDFIERNTDQSWRDGL